MKREKKIIKEKEEELEQSIVAVLLWQIGITMSASGTGGLKVMFRSLILTTLSNLFFSNRNWKKKIGS